MKSNMVDLNRRDFGPYLVPREWPKICSRISAWKLAE